MGLRLFLLAILCAVSARAASPCDPLCALLATPDSEARCYSCRCREALGNWLPNRAELQCSKGEEIVVYRSRPGKPAELEPVPGPVESCHNPALFGGSCLSGSRLGQLTHNDVEVKWICRRNTANLPSGAPYDKVSVIASNTRTGATCFWENYSAQIGDDNLPSLDLAQAPAADVTEFSRHFSVTEGGGCIYCHDNDAFLYTPFLRSVRWKTGSYTKGPFARVMLKSAPVSVGHKQLVSAGAASCTACHRITTGRTCNGWAADSVGDAKDFGHESAVLDATDRITWKNGVKVREPGTEWQLAYWMPPGHVTASGWTQWNHRFGAAKELVLKCCGEIHTGVTSPDCQWTPVPGYQP